MELDNFISFIKYVTSESTMSESACSNLDVRIALNGLAVKSRWHLLPRDDLQKKIMILLLSHSSHNGSSSVRTTGGVRYSWSKLAPCRLMTSQPGRLGQIGN